MKYRPDIDGLRAIAVLPVILYHAGITGFPGGYVGVDVFFVISGYLITTILLNELKSEKFSILKFYERRARRILPALFFVVLITMFASRVIMLPSEFSELSESIIAVTFFVSNIYFWKETGYFDTSSEEKPLLHTWSLAVEEQYYVLFPVMLMIVWRYKRQYLLHALILISMISLALSEWGVRNYPDASYYLSPTKAWELLAGSISAFLVVNYGKKDQNILSCIGFLMILGSIFLFNETTPFLYLYALVPVIGSCLIILYSGPETIVYKILSQRFFVTIGLISYSAYLWHQPIFALSRLYLNTHISIPVGLILSVLSLILAYLTWKYVETPTRKWKFKNSRDILRHSFVASLFIILIASSGLLLNKYWYFNVPLEDEYLANLDVKAQGMYVVNRFEKIRSLNFSSNQETKKILIIGDSFAQDFVNVIYGENNKKIKSEVKTYYISSRCGNLFLDYDISNLQEKENRLICKNKKGYDNEELINAIKMSDYIYLASSWTDWTAKLLEESVNNLSKVTNAQIIVVGRKKFGDVNVRDLLNLSLEKRIAYTASAASDHILVNKEMESAKYNFINMHNYICDAVNKCPLFDGKGHLLSHDGSHLTKFGVEFLSTKVHQDKLVQGVFY